MNIDLVRTTCLSFSGATESVQWGNDLVFKVGGKMFAIMGIEDGIPRLLSFKTSPEDYGDLIERDGIIPAPYLARARWVALERGDVLSSAELKRRLSDSYKLVVESLPKKTRPGNPISKR